MKKFITTAFILLISTALYAETFNLERDINSEEADPSLTKVERRMVVRAEDVADWMMSTSRRSGQSINTQEAARASEIIVQLSRTEEGREILAEPQMLTSQLNRNGISRQVTVEVSIRAAQALQQPKLGGLSIREIIIMPPAIAIKQYPEAIGGEVMLRGSTVKLAEAQQIVEVLSNMIEENRDAFTRHLTTVKMDLIKDWGVKPELADIAVQVIGTNRDKMEIIVPSGKPLARQTSGTMDSRIKEAIRYLQSRGRIDDASKIRSSMKKEGAKLQLSQIADKRGEATVAGPLELGIAIHFLENIHPDGAEFVKEMAAEERLGSMGLQQYIALIKKEMSYEWINIVNRNSLGHIALGDINQQMRKYEGDLMKYAEFGGGKISITKLAESYIRVGDREMPYDLVSLMAREPIYPEQLRIAFEARVPFLEPTQIEAIETLSEFLPSGIRKFLEDAGDMLDMKPYEINGMIKDLEVFRVRAASVENLAESQRLLDERKSFLVHTLVNRPKAVVWLSQVTNPVYAGDTRIVVNEAMCKAIAEFSGISVVRFDYSGRMDVLVPVKNDVKVMEFDEQMAAQFEREDMKPIYVGSSREELVVLQEKAFMLPLYAGLRKKRAAKFNITTLKAIEEALRAVRTVIASKGISLEGIDQDVIPTQFDEIVMVRVSLDDYKAIQAQQRNATGDPADGGEVYFFKNDGSFFRFEGDKDIFGQRFKRSVDVSELKQKIYQGNAVIFAASSFFIDQSTAFKLFGNENYFKYRGGMVSFNDPYMTEYEKGGFLAIVDALDAEMSSAFGKKRSDSEDSWKVLSGVRVSDVENNKATLIYIPRGIGKKGKYILEVSSDLARNPTLIKMRLRNMTIKQAIQEEIVQDTASLTTGILDSFEPGVKETAMDKIVKWVTRKFRNKIEGGSFKGLRIYRLSFKEGAVFLEKEFPERIKIGLLADMTMEIVNVKGADKIRTVLSEISE